MRRYCEQTLFCVQEPRGPIFEDFVCERCDRINLLGDNKSIFSHKRLIQQRFQSILARFRAILARCRGALDEIGWNKFGIHPKLD